LLVLSQKARQKLACFGVAPLPQKISSNGSHFSGTLLFCTILTSQA